ncbi:hypothetical protein MC7420_6950 [Coleofasciculus chthonoplastes PCC 7420]|uniref:DUF1822 domain-containing protein n=1 Tax=Coleofasciculus chthonoplastes PCC 7420 TaxID=118168 RepID=B4W1Y5_9CYAN|nr:DUF1822 family protein [Coleofasciculus chthonoplastes]EDX71864.1 hypothetical protein MC7420_6950 [Coleofasciculus chthonoplastes PCC 7420]
MNEIVPKETFSVALTKSVHYLANQSAKQQSNPEIAQQVYFNTLTVHTVNFYCQCMGIETNLLERCSQDLVASTSPEVADLSLKNIGTLKCIPVGSESQVVKIPAEVRENQIGYLVVQFNESLTEGTLLGFAKTVKTSELPFIQLGSLEDFLEEIETLTTLINLSQWFENIFEKGWQNFTEAFKPSAPQPAWRFMPNPSQVTPVSHKNKQGRDSESFPSRLGMKKPRVTGVKPINLGTNQTDYALDLVVSLTEAVEQKIDIEVQIHPRDRETLPLGLTLSIIDEAGQVFSERSARINSTILTKRFRGKLKEQFTLKLSLAEASFTENFAV